MTPPILRTTAAAVAYAGVLALATPVHGGHGQLASLSGKTEVPPNAGTGTVTAAYD